MTRPLLALLGIAWLMAGVAGIVIGLLGAEWLVARLPPLVVETSTVGGAATAIGVALVVIAAVHAAVVIGLRPERRWATTAGILLSAIGCVGMLGVAATAASSLARTPERAPLLGAGIAVALLGAAAYGWCAASLVRRRVGIGPSGDAS